MSKSRSREQLLEVEGVQEIVESNSTKSNKFVNLYELGLTVSEIGKVTDSVYSFVYGVIDKYSDGEIRKNKGNGDSWSKKFVEDYKAGASIGDIAKRYNKNYSYVWVCIDKYRKGLKK